MLCIKELTNVIYKVVTPENNNLTLFFWLGLKCDKIIRKLFSHISQVQIIGVTYWNWHWKQSFKEINSKEFNLQRQKTTQYCNISIGFNVCILLMSFLYLNVFTSYYQHLWWGKCLHNLKYVNFGGKKRRLWKAYF